MPGHGVRPKTKGAQETQDHIAQLSLPLLDEELDAHPGEFIPLPINIEDIGGELLAIVSTGLYTEPLDCIREYVQNAVDANARTATIKITGNSVHIFDDGDGMTLEELVHARRVGITSKKISSNVGFRGIGLYSSFGLCNQLRVTTKRLGEGRQHLIVLDFAAMRAQLEEDKRKNLGERKTPLIDLLSAHTKISRGKYAVAEDAHFTHVEMQEIDDEYVKKLSNREELKQYMIRHLPIDFDPTFEYREHINQELYREVPGYNVITVTLQCDGLPDLLVTKPPIPNLQPPKMGAITTTGSGKNGKRVAYFWACLNKERDRLATNARFVPAVLQSRDSKLREAFAKEFVAYEGFVYKMKGFSVGGRDRLRNCFLPKPVLYQWYTGEIYVVDDEVIPKADRGDFETNKAKEDLEMAVLDALSKLEEAAEKFQASGVADEHIDKYERELERIEKEVASNTQRSDLQTYTVLNDILKDLRRQQKVASPEKRPIADSILKRAEHLQKQIAKERAEPLPEATRRKRAANVEHRPPMARETLAEPPHELSNNNTPVTALADQESLFSQEPLSDNNTIVLAAVTPSSKRLEEILLEVGWRLDEDCITLIRLLQESLENMLLDTGLYQGVLSDFEDRLNKNFKGLD